MTAALVALALAVVDPNALSPQAAAEAVAIGKLLRCPVCQGMPIAESPSTMAQDMMQRVRELLGEGRSRDEVLGYFIERYGEWVLLDPPGRGFNLVVWLGPPVALLAGLAVVWATLRRRPRAMVETAPLPPSDDPDLQAIRDEVQR